MSKIKKKKTPPKPSAVFPSSVRGQTVSLLSWDAHSSISGGCSTRHPAQLEPHSCPSWLNIKPPMSGKANCCGAEWRRVVCRRRIRACVRHLMCCQLRHAYPEVVLSRCHNINLLDKKCICRPTPTLTQGSTDAGRHGCTWHARYTGFK